MLIIRTSGANQAWRQTLQELYSSGAETGNATYFRDEVVVIELSKPELVDPDPLFPMPAEELAAINRFIHSGENESSVTHEWTKLYHHRMFDQPNSQIEYLLKVLAEPEPRWDSLVSLWDKTVDQNKLISPCTLVIWGRKRHGKLELHVHAHSSDAYKKLLMNLQEFISLHQFLAEKLLIEMGTYYHFLDSCHIHREDIKHCEQLLDAF
jgi:thymidylate synthase